MYGMGERSNVQIAEALDSDLVVKDITLLTAWFKDQKP